MTITVPAAAQAADLRARIDGHVLVPGDPAYAEHCLAWNRAYRHRPALIVIPSSAADVSAAVRHAAAHGLPVTVQATGHGVVGVADDAMLVLTHLLDGVAVDGDAWTARIGAGAKWEKVLGPACDAGLAPLLGSTPDVSAVGYTLGGGMGWLARKYGLSADRVRWFEIVTADGEVRTTCPESEPDLFWALRGGGAGSLGVVTAMEIDLVPVQSLYAGNLLYPAGLIAEVGARYRDWVAGAPDELTSSLALMNFPPLEEVPEAIRGRSFAIVRGAYAGPDADGEKLLRHWRGWREPELDMWGPMPFSQVAAISNDPVDPTPSMSSSEWLDDVSDDVVAILAGATFPSAPGPSPLLFSEIRHAGGAIARGPEHPGAYGNRARRHVLQMVGVAAPGPDFDRLAGHVAALRRRLAPHRAGGAYLNFLEAEEKVQRSSEGFESHAWERLKAVKSRYDPANVFARGLALG